MPMIAITTSISMSVNAAVRREITATAPRIFGVTGAEVFRSEKVFIARPPFMKLSKDHENCFIKRSRQRRDCA
jgi:hypothetical protein